MITTTSWVRRGVAAQFPTKYEINEGEMERISKLARVQLEGAQEDLKAAKEGKNEEEDGDGNDGDENKAMDGGGDAMEEDTNTKKENGDDQKQKE